MPSNILPTCDLCGAKLNANDLLKFTVNDILQVCAGCRKTTEYKTAVKQYDEAEQIKRDIITNLKKLFSE